MGRTAAAFPLVPRVHEEGFQPLHPRSHEGARTRARRESTGESSDTLTQASPGVLVKEREAMSQLLFSGTNLLQISANIDLVFLSKTSRSPGEFCFHLTAHLIFCSLHVGV